MQSFLKVICVLNFLFFSSGLVAQNEVTDSLSTEERLFEEAAVLLSEKKYQEAIDKYDTASMLFLEKGNKSGFDKCNEQINEICKKTVKMPIEFFDEKVKYYAENYGAESFQLGIWYYYYWVQNLKVTKNTSKAEEEVTKAVDVFKKLGSEREALLAKAYLGDINQIKRDNEKAGQIFKECLEEIQSLYNQNTVTKTFYDIHRARFHYHLAIINKSQGAFESAVENFKIATDIYLEYEKWIDVVKINYTTAQLYFKVDNDIAIDYLQKAAYYFETYNVENYFIAGAIQLQLGSIRLEQLQYDEALKHHKKSGALFEKEFGPGNQYTGIAYSNVGVTHMIAKQWEEAEVYLRKAMIIYEETIPIPNSNKSSVYTSLADVWKEQGIKLDSALILSDKAIANDKQIYKLPHQKIARGYLQKVLIYRDLEQFDLALENAQQALITSTYEFESLDTDQNPTVEDFQQISFGSGALVQKARLYVRTWRKDKSKKELIGKAINCLIICDSIVNITIKKFGEKPWRQDHFVLQLKRTVQTVANFYYEFYQETGDPGHLDAYFSWMEKRKAQELLIAFQNSEVQADGKIPKDVLDKELSFQAQMDSLETLLFKARNTGDSVAIAKLQNEDLANTRREQSQFLRDLKREYSNYYESKYDFAYTNRKTVQESLDEKTLYLEFIVHSEKNPFLMYYLGLTKSEEYAVQGSLPIEFPEKIAEFNKLLRSHNLLRADRRRKFIALSNELYQLFIQPVEHLLEGKERLVIVGEGVTHNLPFEALLKNKEEKPWHELDFLIRDHEISYHYSGTLFARAQAKKKEFENELLAFAPVFSDENSALVALRAEGLEMADSTFRSIQGDHFSPLPHSEKEVNSIGFLFPNSNNVNILLNEDANEINLKSALEKNHRFVHIASHSFANIDYPKFSGIACHPAQSESEKEDGILYVGEIYNLALNSDLVVLSSCESGVGKLLDGEGMLGLNRSFVYAGVPNVIFSLWKVYDEATGKLMTEFYKNTLNGDSYSKALRTAKLKMLEDPKTAAPDIWGAFLLIGR